jgi:hypothetical protein
MSKHCVFSFKIIQASKTPTIGAIPIEILTTLAGKVFSPIIIIGIATLPYTTLQVKGRTFYSSTPSQIVFFVSPLNLTHIIKQMNAPLQINISQIDTSGNFLKTNEVSDCWHTPVNVAMIMETRPSR